MSDTYEIVVSEEPLTKLKKSDPELKAIAEAHQQASEAAAAAQIPDAPNPTPVEDVPDLAEWVQEQQDASEPTEVDPEDYPPNSEAPRRFQAAWADRQGIEYPKSATGADIADLITDWLNREPQL